MSPWTAPPFRFCLIMLIFSLVAGFDLPTALAADNLPPQREAALSELAETVQHTAQLPGGAAVAATLDDDIPIWCPRCFLGTDNVYSGEGIRYLVVRLIVGNHTIAPLELNRRKITLTTDRQTLTAGERPPSFREMPLEIDWHPQGHIRSQRELETPESITIPPSRSVEFWCVFAPLDASPGVPPLTLSLSFANGQNAELDLNAQQQARLGLTTEFIGPEHALQILTVHGQLNRISTGTLAAAMKGAAEQGCRRFLIAWDDAAAPSDDAIYSWLLTTVVESGRDNALYLQMPMLPAVIDLGLANLPEENRDLFVAGDASATHIFERSDEAAIALLRDIYDHVDRAVVLEQVRDGHPWSQQAALETAGNRLGTDALPLLLELSRRESGPLRRAALIALGQQQSPLAVERLKQVALGTDATDAIAALRSLMTGASPGDRQLVLELLDSPLSVPPVARIDLLAETYHPDWNPVLAAAVQSPLPEVRERALTALRQLGHPDLVEMAIEALSDENQSVRESAFSVLVDRTDHRSEQAALKFALDQLAQGRVPPSALTLIERLRASEAAPLLLKQIRSSTLPRETLIVTLGTIGTDDDLRALLNEMQDLSAEEQVAALEFAPVLSTAAQLELARNAASSDEVILRVAALELLKRIGTDDVVQILKMMYAQGPDDEREMVCMTLGEIGLDAAVQALRTLRQQAVQEDDSEALNAVDQGLRNWRSRLPGWNYVESGLIHSNAEDHEAAIKAFSMALVINPDLAEAYSARGNAYLRQKQYSLAGADFRRAYELEPLDDQAITGVAIIQAIEGEWEQALEFVSGQAKRFRRNPYFAYNTACVCGRAIEYLQKQPSSATRDENIKRLQQAAVDHLRDAVEYGFEQFDWMQRDPDLATLRDLPDFKSLGRSR